MEKIHALRLTYLAWFLGEILPPRFFNLRSYTNSRKPKRDEILNREIAEGKPECGTTACALGWCPYLFPTQWHFSRYGTPLITEVDSGEDAILSEATYPDYFGITETESDHLFFAGTPRSAKEESVVIINKLANYKFDYNLLLAEAKAMFGEDLPSRFHPVCPVESTEQAN